MLRLFSNPRSPHAAKVHYFLEETAIPYVHEPVVLGTSDGRARLEAVNPFSKIPAIELDGFTLGESNAILRYLAARYGRHDFYPLNLEDRARVDLVMEFASQHVIPLFSTIAFNLNAHNYGMKGDEAVIADSRQKLVPVLERLERGTAGHSFLVGPAMTLADVTLLPFTARAEAMGVPLTSYPGLAAWTARLSARPAWKKVAAM